MRFGLLRRGFAGGPSSLFERVRPHLLASDLVLPRGVTVMSEDRLALSAPFDCSTCGEKVADVQSLWICHSCGEYRSNKCLSTIRTTCTACGAKNTVLNLPNRLKAERGMLYLRYVFGSSAGLFIRLAVHAVAMDGLGAFLDANKLRAASKKKEADALYNYSVKCFNWIRLSAPAFFHACGYDADLVRSVAMRSSPEESAKIAAESPELFVNQTILPVHSVLAKQVRKGDLGGKVTSLFVEWDKVSSR
jgi:hypothetical protein